MQFASMIFMFLCQRNAIEYNEYRLPDYSEKRDTIGQGHEKTLIGKGKDDV